MFHLFYCNSIPLTSVPNWRKAIQEPIVNLYQVWITFFEQRFCPFDVWPFIALGYKNLSTLKQTVG